MKALGKLALALVLRGNQIATSDGVRVTTVPHITTSEWFEDENKVRNSVTLIVVVPPGNHLESLKGKRRGQHSIRINDQWRVCFRWVEAGAEDVEIVDYH